MKKIANTLFPNDDAKLTKYDIGIVMLLILSLLPQFFPDSLSSDKILIINSTFVAALVAEFIVKICVAHIHYQTTFKKGVRKYLFSLEGLVDFLGLLSFVPLQIGKFDAVPLKLVRLVRIAKMFRNFKTVKIIRYIISENKFFLLVTGIFAMSVVLMAAIILYRTEHNAQPDKIRNLGDAIWMSLITLTTVGYGDLYPITVLGRVTASIVAVFGIGVIALPSGLFASELSKILAKSSQIESGTRRAFSNQEKVKISEMLYEDASVEEVQKYLLSLKGDHDGSIRNNQKDKNHSQ